jgi:hypothetical protein
MDPDPGGPKTCRSGSLTLCQSSGGDVLIFYDNIVDSDPDLNLNRLNRWIRLCVLKPWMFLFKAGASPESPKFFMEDLKQKQPKRLLYRTPQIVFLICFIF